MKVIEENKRLISPELGNDFDETTLANAFQFDKYNILNMKF